MAFRFNPFTGELDKTEAGTSTGYTEVNTYADLPDATENDGAIYIVKTATKVLWLINWYNAGFYRSNGTSWDYLGPSPETTSLKVGSTTVVGAPVELVSGEAVTITPDAGNSRITLAAQEPGKSLISKGWDFRDDFNFAATTSAANDRFASESGLWTLSLVNTGVVGFGDTALSSTTAHGIIKCSTGASSNGVAGFYRLGGVSLGGGYTLFETKIYLSALPDGATENYLVRIRLGNNSGISAATNTLEMAYLQGTSPYWLLYNTAASVGGANFTSTAPIAGAWLKLQIIVNAAGNSVSYYQNGALVGTVGTNIPTASLGVSLAIGKTAGTANYDMYVDWVRGYSLVSR